MTTAIDRMAESLGRALGTFQRARQQARQPDRPRFFSGMSREYGWQGGWSWQAGSGSDLERGKRAIQNSWVFSCIEMIAREVSASTFQVLEHHGPDEEATQIANHPLEKLLRQPNQHMGRAFLWQYSTWWLKLDGNFYWFVLVDDDGQPVELWPLPSFAVRPVFGDGERIIDHYEYWIGGTVYRIPTEYIVHVKRPNPFNPFIGLSELVAAMLPADSDTSMARWNAAFFGKQNTMPSAIINLSSGDPQTPINPADRERLEADLIDDYAAYERRTFVTTANSITAELLGWNPQEMDFLAGREFTKSEIFTIYGVHLGVVDPNAIEANAKVGEQRFKETVWALLGLIAEQLTVELVEPFYAWWVGAPELEAGFEDIRPLDRELALRERESAKGVLTIQEIRADYYQKDPLGDERDGMLETEVVPATAGDFGIPDFNFADVPIPQVITSAIDADLRKWRTKALRAFKRGQSPDVDFESAVIPPDLIGHLRLHLQAARSAADIAAAFEEVADYRPFLAMASD
jgi:HK97 family phage portal protein